MRVETYGRLKLYFSLIQNEFQSEILITLVSMMYLSKDYRKFNDFYKNSYLIDIMQIEKLPDINKLIKALSIIGDLEENLNTKSINKINYSLSKTSIDNYFEIDEKIHSKLLNEQKLIYTYIQKIVDREDGLVEKK